MLLRRRNCHHATAFASHPLGYPITLLDGIHGAACAVFEGDFIRYNQRTEVGARKINEIAAYLGTTPETDGLPLSCRR